MLGIRILKAFGRSAHLGSSFRAQARQLRATELGKARVISALWATVIALPEIAFALILFLGIREVAHGQMSAGTLVAFFGTAMNLRWPIDSIGWLLAAANDAASAAERYFEVLDAPVTVTSPETPVQPTRTGGHLQFRDVWFRFPDAEDPPRSTGGAAARCGSRPAPGGECRRGRCDRLRQDRPDGSGEPSLRRHRWRNPAGRRGHPRAGPGRTPIAGGDGVRGAHAVLRLGARERPAGASGSRRRAGAPGARDRPGRFRRRPALGAGHPDRGAGFVAVGRAAAAARTGPRRRRQSVGPGDGRPVVRVGHPYRGPGRAGTAVGAAWHHRPDHRPPGVDRDAGRPGGTARARPDHRAGYPLRPDGNGPRLPRSADQPGRPPRDPDGHGHQDTPGHPDNRAHRVAGDPAPPPQEGAGR